MSRFFRGVALLLAGASAGCDSGFGTFDGGPVRPPPPFPPQSEPASRIREDFNNLDLIESQSGGVIVDVNRGIVTLDAQMFPNFSGDGAVSSFDRPTYQNGLVEAETIIIHESATLEASDSIELRAEDSVIVAGSLTVGRGGISIIARHRIQIDGRITSEGPVRLLLGDDNGAIQITGSINAIGSGDMSIYGRGSVLIGGEIWTSGSSYNIGGNLDVYAYGDLTVSGPGAHVYTTAQLDGEAGSIALQSESQVFVDSGAWLGGVPPEPLVPDYQAPTGNIEIKAGNITIGDDVIVAASGASLREGGKVLLTGTGRLFTGHRTQIAAGYGPSGGSVILKAASIELGEATRVAAGGGSAEAGRVEMHAVESITMYPFSSIEGGFGQCSRGGDIFVEVGGLLSASEGARIIGGAGNVNVACGRQHPGGAITIFARETAGLDAAIVPGTGASDGDVNLNLIDDYTVPPSNLQVAPGGQVESRTIDRGSDALETIPRLVEIVANTPPDTAVTVLLAGAAFPDGPFEEWLPINSDANDKRFERFIGQRYVRYRVMLEGRKFDAPVLDYFEIDLAPRGY